MNQALRDRHRPAHARRTAESHAAFLLPHLKPGMVLLDVGCGPGSITAGLAAAVAPGPTTGVDLDPGSPEDFPGVTFCQADAYELPFPEASFDAIFICAVLQHLTDPLGALREARRVARSGAVIGVADADWGGRLLWPADPILESSYSIMEKLHQGSPFVGRGLKALLVEAGFTQVEASARTIHHSSSDEVRGFAAFNASWFTTDAMVRTAVRQGWATVEEMAATSAAWRAWGEHPGAFFAGFWCEAIGRAPRA